MGPPVRLSHVNAEPARRFGWLGSTVIVGSASWFVSPLRLFGTMFTRRLCATLGSAMMQSTKRADEIRNGVFIVSSPSQPQPVRERGLRPLPAARRTVLSRDKWGVFPGTWQGRRRGKAALPAYFA